jgi:bifunctional enzyme CysN/CysC
MNPHMSRPPANVHRTAVLVGKAARVALNGHQPAIVWFTGLSGAGKSTIASLVERELHSRGIRTYLLDGDNLRYGLNRDLGFQDSDRAENVRRAGEVAKLFVDAGLVVLCAFISPFRADREMVREQVEPNEFIEIFVDTPLEECARRDAKGLYAKARTGQLANLTGINSPYEAPDRPELVLRGTEPVAALASRVLELLMSRHIIAAGSRDQCAIDRRRSSGLLRAAAFQPTALLE